MMKYSSVIHSVEVGKLLFNIGVFTIESKQPLYRQNSLYGTIVSYA